MDPAAIVAGTTANLQQDVQVSMLLKEQDTEGAMLTQLLNSTSAGAAPTPRVSPPGVGTVVDRYA